MKMSKALRDFADKAKARDSYWVEKAKLEFSLSLEGRRRAADMTYKALADKLGTSAAYITKVFRGDTNLTIESMVKLARATGGRLDIRIVDAAAVAQSPWKLAAIPGGGAPRTITSTSASIIAFPIPANNDKYKEQIAA